MRDEELIRGKVPMSKMEVRAVSLAYLDLYEAKHLLDIGAGTGSVSVEAAKRHRGLQVTAVERDPEGCALIRENALRHRAEVRVVEGLAPCGLTEDWNGSAETCYDRVFLGGTGKQLDAILNWLADGLMADGAILVANAIAIESLYETFSALKAHGFQDVEGSMIQASRLEELGQYHYFKPLNPCYVIKAIWRKSWQNS